MSRGAMDHVELLEEGVPDPDVAEPTLDGAATFRRRVRRALRWSRRRWPVLVVAAAVVAVGVAGPVLLAARAEHARLSALPALPRLLRPVDGSLHVAWTSAVPLQYLPSMGPERAWLRDDALVLWTEDDDGQSQWLRALDAGDGSRMWETKLTERPATPEPANHAGLSFGIYDPTQCLAPPRAIGDGVIVCLVVREWRTVTPEKGPGDVVGDGDVARLELEARPASLHLVGVRAATGEVLFSNAVEPDSSIAVVDGDVL